MSDTPASAGWAQQAPRPPFDIGSSMKSTLEHLEQLLGRTDAIIMRINGPSPVAPTGSASPTPGGIRDMGDRIDNLLSRLQDNISTLDAVI